MNWALAVLVLLGMGLTGRMLWTEQGEVQDKTFASLAEARQQNAIEKGWIPEFVPADAKDIQLHFDLDSNHLSGQFVSKSLDLIRNHCTKSLGHRQGQAGTAQSSQDYEVLGCDSGNFSVAIESTGSTVFYWYGR